MLSHIPEYHCLTDKNCKSFNKFHHTFNRFPNLIQEAHGFHDKRTIMYNKIHNVSTKQEVISRYHPHPFRTSSDVELNRLLEKAKLELDQQWAELNIPLFHQ